MFFNSFVVLTDTPARLASFLESRGIIKQETNPVTGTTSYVGVRPGMEWMEVENPIETAPGVQDTRHAYLVKFSHESQADEESEGGMTVPGVDADGQPIQVPVNPYDWSKFGKWVKNNSTTVTAPAGWKIRGQPAGDAYKVNGQNVWLIRDDPERFGVWQ